VWVGEKKNVRGAKTHKRVQETITDKIGGYIISQEHRGGDAG